MSLLFTLLSFLALAVLALFFSQRFALGSGGPLAAVSASVLLFTVCGCLGFLRGAGWLYFALAAAAAFWLCTEVFKKKKRLCPGAGFWLFLLGGGCLILLFGLREPLFTGWDEFSLWGAVCKLTKEQNVLFTQAATNWPWNQSQVPGLSVFSYLFEFFGAFAEWRVYAAYDVLILAAFAALLIPFEKKDWNIALPVALSAFLVPFLIFHYGPVSSFSTVYLSAYADLPLGALFAGALALYFGQKGKGAKALWPAALALMALTLLKDIGFALAMIAAVLICADLWLVQRGGNFKKPARTGFLFGAGLLLAPPAAFLGWSFYMARAPHIPHVESIGTQSVGMLQMPFMGLKELFSPNKSEKFTHVMSRMTQEFFSVRDTMLGSGFLVCALILALLALAFFTFREKKQKRTTALFALLSAAGFAAYFLFLAFTYIYIFIDSEAYAIVGYERYVGPFFVGWLLLALCFAGQAAKGQRWLNAGKWALLALSALFFIRVFTVIPPSRTFLNVNDEMFTSRRAFNEKVEGVTSRLCEGDRVYIVSQDDDGIKWFKYSYEFLPVLVDYSFGGGAISPEKEIPAKAMGAAFTLEEQKELLSQKLTAEVFARYLLYSDCDKLFIDNADEQFRQDYGSLFQDGLAGYFNGSCDLYSIEQTQTGVLMVPVQP